MKKSATITLTMAAALGASAHAQTAPVHCDPGNPTAGQNTTPCSKPRRHGLAAIFHGGFGATGAGTSAGS